MGGGMKRQWVANQSVDDTKIIYAVKMIGMRVGQYHRVEPRRAGVEHLLAQIGRGVDQERLAAAFHQERAAPPGVARIGRVAAAPVRADRRHAPGGAAAEQGCLHRGAGRTAFWNRRKKLSVVAAANS